MSIAIGVSGSFRPDDTESGGADPYALTGCYLVVAGSLDDEFGWCAIVDPQPHF